MTILRDSYSILRDPEFWLIVVVPVLAVAALIVALEVCESRKPPCIKWSEPRTVLIPISDGKTIHFVPSTRRDCLERAVEKPE